MAIQKKPLISNLAATKKAVIRGRIGLRPGGASVRVAEIDIAALALTITEALGNRRQQGRDHNPVAL